ncbi:MAG: hypothetical protein AAF721_15265 [Myxococcota bacterium]
MNTSLFCALLGSSLALAACDNAGKSEAKPGSAAKASVAAGDESKAGANSKSDPPSAKPTKADAPAAEPAPAAEDPLALTEVTPEGFWPIKIPKGAKPGPKTDTLAMYGMRDGDLNIQVKVFRGGGHKKLAKAKKWADMEMANSEIVDAKEVAKGVFEVVMERKSDGFNTVVMYNKDDRMVCYGTKVEVSLLRTICSTFPGAPAPSDAAPAAAEPVAKDEGAGAPAGGGAHHCDLIKPIATCFQWELDAAAVGPKKEFCEGSGGKFVAGACPAKNDLGTCVLKGDKDIHYYGKKFKPASAEKECTGMRAGSWTAK